MGTPTSDVIDLDVTPPGGGAAVHLLGHDAPLRWDPTSDGCRVTLPGQPAEAPALTLRIAAAAR